MSAPSPQLSAAQVADLLQQPAPTDEQVAIIEAPLEPMLVVAGAGSGKTETMASRVVWLIANEIVRPRDVLGLTFTRKAAHELAERIGARLAALTGALRANGMPVPDGLSRSEDDVIGERPVVHTYNGFALDLVMEHALAIGLDSELTMMSASAAWQLAHELVETWDAPATTTASAATLTAAVISLTSSLADHLSTPAELRDELEAMRHHLSSIPLQAEGRKRTAPPAVAKTLTGLEARLDLVELLEAFTAERMRSGRLDFADQVALAARIAREVPAARDLARAQHRVVLLDEFQDTSVAQLQLLADLFGAGHPAIAVGDPQQAIYGWRGASAASLASFTRAFATEQPVTQRTLSTSWRNDQAVLALANRIAQPLRNAAAGLRVPELRARPGAGEGAVEICQTADTQREAQVIAAWIQRCRDTAEPDAPLSAAVLVRARRQIPVIAQELEAAGLSVDVVGLGGLLHRPAVADVRALLTCAHDPSRGDALMRLLTGPRIRLGARDLAVLGAWTSHLGSRRRTGSGAPDPSAPPDDADQVTLVDGLDDLPPEDWTDCDGRSLSATARRRLAILQKHLRDIRRLLPLPLPDLITAAVHALDVDLAVLDREDDTTGAQGRRALADLDALRDHAAAFARTARSADLGAWLDLLEISEDREAGLSVGEQHTVPDPAAVTVVTMHSAKGLEWDLVAIAGLTEGSVPSYDLRRARADDTGRVRVPDSGWLGPLADAAVPTALRGDADTLPELAWAQADTQVDAEQILQDWYLASGEESLLEDRRLMYVAITRARRRLLLTSAAWREGLSAARPRSRYLQEALDLVPERFRTSETIPEENPLDAAPRSALWPPETGAAEQARDRASALLHEALHAPAAVPEEPVRRVLADLAARTARHDVPMPVQQSASRLVRLVDDPEAAALALLRPVPRRPSPAARRGSAFHAWLEHRWSDAALLDLEDLDAITDLEPDDPDAPSLEDLRRAFTDSPWSGRTPIAVERSVQVHLGPFMVRGVIDAVFADPDGTDGTDGVIIVDWKTGHTPPPARRRALALQLSVYRLAWHQITGLPLERIRTAFHYVPDSRTIEVSDHPSVDEILDHLGEFPSA